MRKYYYELRQLVKPVDRVAVDLARHLQTRHHLGTAVVICDNPHALMSAVRKQWLRLSRQLQRLRASTLNAEEILRHTRAIMQMQQAHFTVKSPNDNPDATVYFMSPDTHTLPHGCTTVYASTHYAHSFRSYLADKALLVSYNSEFVDLAHFLPKTELEEAAMREWRKISNIFDKNAIDPLELSLQDISRHYILDQALDVLIADSADFLTQAFAFQHAVDLAQPFSTISPTYQRAFEAVTRLAYRVNTLTPKSNLPQFAAKDNYFLRDPGSYGNDMDGVLFCETVHYKPATSATI